MCNVKKYEDEKQQHKKARRYIKGENHAVLYDIHDNMICYFGVVGEDNDKEREVKTIQSLAKIANKPKSSKI